MFRGADGAPPANRDIAVWPLEYDAHRVPEYSEHVDPLAYVLLFPYGTQG